VSVQSRLTRLEKEKAARIALDSAAASALLTRQEVEATVAVYQLEGNPLMQDAIALDRLRELTATKEACEALVSLMYAGLVKGCEAMKPETRRAIGWPDDPATMRAEQATDYDHNVAWVQQAAAELADQARAAEARA